MRHKSERTDGRKDGRTDKGKSKCPPLTWGHKNCFMHVVCTFSCYYFSYIKLTRFWEIVIKIFKTIFINSYIFSSPDIFTCSPEVVEDLYELYKLVGYYATWKYEQYFLKFSLLKTKMKNTEQNFSQMYKQPMYAIYLCGNKNKLEKNEIFKSII
jgi:hypothetical protein